MKKIVINQCYGGFGLSDAAYEHLIGQGVPVKAYVEPKLDPKTGLYKHEPDEEVIYDRTLGPDPFNDAKHILFTGRYWETWLGRNREDPRLIATIEALGTKANKPHTAELVVVEIPDDVNYTIEEYDGLEHVAEVHRTWR